MRAALSVSIALLCGCSGSEDDADFTYGRVEMESAVLGTWHGSWTPAGGEAAPLSLVIDTKTDPSARRTACGNQTFATAPASRLQPACVSMSSLAVTGILSAGDPLVTFEDLSGSYMVFGVDFSPGELYLSSADAALTLMANQGENLVWESCSVQLDGSALDCTLEARE